MQKKDEIIAQAEVYKDMVHEDPDNYELPNNTANIGMFIAETMDGVIELSQGQR